MVKKRLLALALAFCVAGGVIPAAAFDTEFPEATPLLEETVGEPVNGSNREKASDNTGSSGETNVSDSTDIPGGAGISADANGSSETDILNSTDGSGETGIFDNTDGSGETGSSDSMDVSSSTGSSGETDVPDNTDGFGSTDSSGETGIPNNTDDSGNTNGSGETGTPNNTDDSGNTNGSGETDAPGNTGAFDSMGVLSSTDDSDDTDNSAETGYLADETSATNLSLNLEGPTGELCLELHRRAALTETTFSVVLYSEENNFEEKKNWQAAQGESLVTLAFSDIPDGEDYVLKISAPYYLSYVQEDLKFDGRCIHLELYNYASVNEHQTPEDGHFSVIPVGDVNEDGQINDADADAIADAIHNSNTTYDLNGDGATGLNDLTIAVRNQSEVIPASPVYTVSSKVLAKAVSVQTDTGTELKQGNLSELLNQQTADARVQLSASGTSTISENNPVSFTMEVADVTSETTENPVYAVEAKEIVITAPPDSENTILEGSAIIETMSGNIIQADLVPFSSNAATHAVVSEASLEEAFLWEDAAAEDAPTSITPENPKPAEAVVISLGKRVAIKKVTIRVTKTANSEKLVDIAKVEFFSDFAERVSEPQLSIPEITSVSNTESDGQGFKNLTISWGRMTNVTGYEVKVSGNGYNKTAVTSQTSYTFMGDSFNGTVRSFLTYQIQVRSVSGDWKSDWSEPYNHTVTCHTRPPKPIYLSATTGVEMLHITWECKFDAQRFSLYYKATESDGDFTCRDNITTQHYTLTGLQGGTSYTFYVIAHNANGSSPASDQATAKPTTPAGVVFPRYKLLNTDDTDGQAMTHITGISGKSNKSYEIYWGSQAIASNSTATANDWKAIADNDPETYVNIPDWDSGVSYANFRGPIIQMDNTYTMDTIRLAPHEAAKVSLYAVRIDYKDESGAIRSMNTSLSAKYDAQNRKYYEIIMNEPITTDYLEIHTRNFNTGPITICEVRLYDYDDLEHKVADLFTDHMRTVVKDSVTLQDIQALTDRANTIDPISHEYHPHRNMILNELSYAQEFLLTGQTAKIIRVDNLTTAKNQPASGFAQALSDYQPLGYVAAAGDTLILYVSDGVTARGNNVNLQLIATQYHPQVTAWQRNCQLKAGRNEITLTRIGNDNKEAGGALYLQYTGVKGQQNYEVRVSGGTAIPVLQLDNVPDAERPALIHTYINELEEYVSTLQTKHNQLHKESDNALVNIYDYTPQDCFLNTTDITMENMMFSVPATQVLAGLGSGDKADRLLKAIQAMEQEIDYFYQFKGLHRDAVDNDRYPDTRLNIRYHKMFTGAFMYAAGKHIGIEFGSVAGLFGTNPVITDANGKKISGNYTGWGIAHEIGHCLNAASYQRVEVTNNMFAQLAQTNETSVSFRTSYQNVYKAVATGKTGHTGNLAVQLAMYWQLHLAYDNDYTYKQYETIEAQQAGLFYARLESYLRDRTKATPALPSGSGDQVFMQAACAAAGKNILHFFRAWGFTPDANTEAYAANFPVETRKIQYIDDDSRLYRMENVSGMSTGTEVIASITNAENSRIYDNKVQISLKNTNSHNNAMLGYEISRNGKMVAFVTADQMQYTDIVTTENNKAFVYTITGIDRLLNETGTLTLPEVKVCHDGEISKDTWTVSTNMTSSHDRTVTKNEDDPDAGITEVTETISAISAVIDNNSDTVYYGTAGSTPATRPYIIIDMGSVEQVTALKFTAAKSTYTGNASEGKNVAAGDLFKYRLFGYTIEISLDGEEWTTVKSGDSYTGSAGNPSSWKESSDIVVREQDLETVNGKPIATTYTLYFNKINPDTKELDPYMYTYDAKYIRVRATNMSGLAIAELDVLGPTSDNVELSQNEYGRLTTDYVAGEIDGEPCVIPAGSVVFYGSYKGDPAYNVVVMRDQNGKIIDGSQIILAEVAEQGALGETSDGRWIFWLEDKTKVDDEGDSYNEFDQLAGLESVMVELRRVQDAMALTGERVTSTSLHLPTGGTWPDVTITSDIKNASLMAWQNEISEISEAVPANSILTGQNLYNDARNIQNGSSETGSKNIFTLPALRTLYYASSTSTGNENSAANTDDTTSRIRLIAQDDGSAQYILNPDGASIAVQSVFSVPSAIKTLLVELKAVKDVYQTYIYNDGMLTLYSIAKTGLLYGKDLTGTITSRSGDGDLTAENMKELKSDYAIMDFVANAYVSLREISDNPGTGGNNPGGGDNPGTGGNNPGGGDNPGTGGNNPGSGDNPGTGGNNPGSGDNPGTGGNNPGTGGNNPGTGGNNPGSGDTPGTGGNNPGTGGNNPGTGGNNPGTGGNNPGSGDNPGTGGNNPGTGSNNPGTGGNNPGSGDNPGTGGNNPSTGDNNPGTGGNNPGSGDNPGTGDNNPGGGVPSKPDKYKVNFIEQTANQVMRVSCEGGLDLTEKGTLVLVAAYETSGEMREIMFCTGITKVQNMENTFTIEFSRNLPDTYTLFFLRNSAPLCAKVTVSHKA